MKFINRYIVVQVLVNKRVYYVIRCKKDMSLLMGCTKYLKHKTDINCSPNTVKKIAESLTYYYTYLDSLSVTVNQVLEMRYAEQYEHFTDFLNWLKKGNHSKRKEIPKNNTCNSYLQLVFGYYQFVINQWKVKGYIKVLDNISVSYNGIVGVRFTRLAKTFDGFLYKEDVVGRTTDRQDIMSLLEACDNCRNKLLMLILAETGFRIGEALGIKYTQDIDFSNRTISVAYREANDNGARSKNAEIRKAKISTGTYDLLKYYLSEYKEILVDTDYLFVNLTGKHKGKPLNANAVYSTLRLMKKKTGITITPHMFRHYYANERRKCGWSMDKVSRALGHKQLATTYKYMNITDDEMMAAMDQYYEKTNHLYNIEKLI